MSSCWDYIFNAKIAEVAEEYRLSIIRIKTGKNEK